MGIAAKEVVVSSPVNIAELITILNPNGGGEEIVEFNPKQPNLSSAGLSDVALAKNFRNACVDECLRPLVTQGAPCYADAEKVSEALIELVQKIQEDAVDHGPVMTCALEEVRVCAAAVISLLNAQKLDLGAVNQVTEAKEGAKNILSQAFHLTPSYKQLIQELRACQVAHSTMGPLLQTSIDQLSRLLTSDSRETAPLEKALTELPVWRRSLRPGSTKGLEDLVASYAKKLVETMNEVSELESVCKIIAASMNSMLDAEDHLRGLGPAFSGVGLMILQRLSFLQNIGPIGLKGYCLVLLSLRAFAPI